MKIEYVPKRFSKKSLQLIELANGIIDEYQAQGYSLTLRQLYYQLVARDYIPNQQREYKKLGNVIADARLAGMVSWDAIEDRTRNLRSLATWTHPANVVSSAAQQFRLDKWANQNYRLEVWVEKEALAGIVQSACNPLEVPYFSCRGYTSASEMWSAAQRLLGYHGRGQQPIIIHLGDHDPSGIDMTRDITERLALFCGEYDVPVHRIALNADQVATYRPPPNPAKTTDSRFVSYRKEHGNQSWELDALEPRVLDDLITSIILDHRSDDLWAEDLARENAYKARLRDVVAELAKEK